MNRLLLKSKYPKLIPFLLIAAMMLTLSATAAAKKTTVTVAYCWTFSFIKDIVKKFNDTHPDIELKFDPTLAEDKLMTSMSAGSAPNLVLWWDDHIQNWAGRGLILPLDDFIKRQRIKLDDYAEAAVDSIKYKGKVYGMPLDWDPDFALYINNRLYSEAGLDYKNPPIYTSDLEAQAAKLTVRGADGKYSKIGWIPWNGWEFWQIYFAGAFGGSFYNDEKKSVTLNHPKNIEAYNWLSDYTRKYNYSLLNQVPGNAFPRDKQALLTGGDWMAYYFLKENPKLEFSIYRAPYARGAKPFLACSGWSYMIPRGTKNLDATYKVLEFLSDEWAAVEFCKGISWLPANLKARRNPKISNDPVLGWFAKLTNNRDDAIWLSPSPIGKTIWTAAENAAWSVVQQKKGAKEALDEAQKICDKDLKRALSRQLFNK